MKFLLIIILTVFYGCTKYKAQPIFPPNKDYMPPPSAPKPSLLNDPVHIEEWNSKGAMGRRKQEISTLRWKLENPNLNKNQADKLWQKLADEIGFCPSVK
tara:strand:+ start:89 stop:388 length:300 start_codon:yes stop_codon:yes gene_type:complete